MDINSNNNSVNVVRKRKLNLLENGNNCNKRRMSLRKYIADFKENDTNRLVISQVTKCVFLASLCLKPVPHIFQTPVQVEGSSEEIEIKKEPDLLAVVSSPRRRALKVQKRVKKLPHKKSQIKPTIVLGGDNLIIKTECKEDEADPKLGLGVEGASSAPTEDQLQHVMSEDEKFIVELLESIVDIPIVDDLASPEEGSTVGETIGAQLDSVEGLPAETIALPPPPPIERVVFKEEHLTDTSLNHTTVPLFNFNDIKVEKSIFNNDMYILSDRNENVSNYAQVELLEEEEEEQAQYDQQGKKYRKRTPQCKICSQIFPNYMRLKKHKLEHDGDKPYLCLKCGTNHSTLDQLIAHLRIHQGKHPYVCKKCGKGFKTSKSLEKHEPVHVLRKIVYAKKMFKCEVCLKEFRKVCDLERHTRVHTGEKPSVCNICNRRFQQAHNLNKHLLIHTQEKPFSCEICNKKFGRNDVLNRHLLTHSVDKPNHCEFCLKSFIRVSQLIGHKTKYHSNEMFKQQIDDSERMMGSC